VVGLRSEDVTDIIGVINLYALAVDTRRWDLFERIFTVDVEADFGGANTWSDRASLQGDFATIHGIFDATQHVTTNHLVSVHGDRATAMSYVHGRFIRRLPEGDDMFESCGWYDDRLIRTVHGWRIEQRRCRRIWSAGNPLVMVGGQASSVESHALSTAADAGSIAYLAEIDDR
jgi:hypothetical protein